MRVLSLRPEPPGGNALARFDVELTDDIRMFGLRLVRAGDGYRIRFPNAHGCRTASLSIHLSDLIIGAAVAALGADAHDKRAA